MRTAPSPIHAQISATDLPNLSQHQLFFIVSRSPLAPDARGPLSTAPSPQAVVSTRPHVVCLVINLWLRISSRDSLPGENLLKPIPGALKDLVSCCRTSHQNPQHLSQVHSTQPPPSLRSLFRELVNQRAMLGCSHGPSGLFFLSAQSAFSCPGLCSAPVLCLGQRTQANKTYDSNKCHGGNPGRLRQPPC